MHELCEHVFRLLRAEAPRRRAVERDYDPSLPTARSTANQIIQALLNVARNAVQAVGERGRIVMRTRVRCERRTSAPARHELVASSRSRTTGRACRPSSPRRIFYPLVTGAPNGTGSGLRSRRTS